jgi:hypothetical protein
MRKPSPKIDRIVTTSGQKMFENDNCSGEVFLGGSVARNAKLDRLEVI